MPQIDKNKIVKVKRWPLDWENHILNVCKLYFIDKEIEFNNALPFYSYLTDIESEGGFKLEVNYLLTVFEIDEHEYDVEIQREGNFSIKGLVKYVKKIYIDEEGLEGSYSYKNYKLIACISASPFSLLRQIEKVIIKDYDKRNNCGEDSSFPPIPFNFLGSDD